MRIKYIKWKNFNSYGNKLNELNFEDTYSLNQIIGKNGAGKSTLSEVITFALYGTINGKTNSILVNRINKNLFVELEFENNNHSVIIRRGLEPTIFDVIIDNNKELGDIAGKKNVQNILQNYIQIPQNIFNNLIALNVNRFMSFIRLSPYEKRNVIDTLFNLEDINRLYDLLRSDLKILKKEIIDLEKHHTWFLNDISKTNELINELIEQNSANDKTEEQNLKSQLIDLNQELKVLKEKSEKLQLKEKEIKTEEKNHIKVINSLVNQIKDYNKKVSILENDKCPTCGVDLQSDYHLNNKKEFLERIEQLKQEYNEEKKNEIKFQNANSKVYDIRKKLEIKIQEILVEKQNIKNKIQQFDRDVSVKIETLRNKISDNNIEIDALNNNIKLKKTELSSLEKVEIVLDENGFKKVIFKNLLPTFNNQIKKFSSAMGIHYDLSFDDNFNVHLTHLGSEIDIRALSTGENKKLDLVVVFSLIVLMKIQFKNTNLLFLDEVFSGLDISTQQHVIEILDKITQKLSLHCFIINHSDLAIQNFNKVYNIEKKNGFSEIECLSLES